MQIDDYYCLIKVKQDIQIELLLIPMNDSKKIESYKYNYPLYFISTNSSNLFNLLCLHSISSFLSINHVLYLGREIYKAEIALIINQLYIQD